MRQLTAWLVLALGVVVVLTGCDRRRDRVRVRTVERGHLCGPGCVNHFYDGNQVLIANRHRHGPNCGHHWNGDNWVVARSRVARVRGHRCGINCNHFYDGNRAVQLPNHVHSRGCGHVYNGNRWVAARSQSRNVVRERGRRGGGGTRQMGRTRVRRR